MDDFRDEMDFDVDYLYRQVGDEDDRKEEEDEFAEDDEPRRPPADPPPPSRMRQMIRSVPPRAVSQPEREDADPFQQQPSVTTGPVEQQLSELKEAVHQLFLSVCALYEVIRDDSGPSETEGEEGEGGAEKSGSEGGQAGKKDRSPPWWALANLASNALLFLLLLLFLVFK